MSKTLYIVDGNSYLYRAFFAIPVFTTSDGRFTNATYGFTKMIMKVINQKKPDHMVICFDAKGKSFRHEEFTEYKATRDRMPDELSPQIADIKEVIDAFGIPRIEREGVEADDVIASLTKRYRKEGYTIYVVTSDKDMMQLVEEGVFIYDTMKEVIYDREGVKNKMGVFPEAIPDLLGLMGDSADNIPGVKGIGPKTAQTLLERYPSVEAIYAHIEEITGKVKEKLETHKEDALMSRRLAVVKDDVPVEDMTLVHYEPNWEKVKEHFRLLEFSSLLKEITTPEQHEEIFSQGEVEPVDYRAIGTLDAFLKLLKRVHTEKKLAFRVTATSENPLEAQLMGITLSFGLHESYYIPVGETLTLALILEKLQPILEDPSIQKIGHGVKYDLLVLAHGYRTLTLEHKSDLRAQMQLFSSL